MEKQRFKKCKTLVDCNNDPRISAKVYWEIDSGWSRGGFYGTILKEGWRTADNNQHVIHAATVTELCEAINNSRTWDDDPDN
jgi:hypothetical protein